jgi:hypothetical protein
MLGLGYICDKIFGDLVPEEFEWLVDMGCAGIDAATGNLPGAVLLGAKTVQDGARAAGQKGAADAIGIAADVADAVAGEPMTDARKVCGPFGCGVPTFADSGRLRTEGLMQKALPKAVGAGAGAAAGGFLGGKEGAKAGVKAGAGIPGSDAARSAAGAAGVCTGAIVSAIRGKGVKDFMKGYEVGANAAGFAAGAARLQFNPAEDKRSLTRAAAVLGHRGGALIGSLDAAARSDDRGHRPVGLAAGVGAAVLSIPENSSAALSAADAASAARAGAEALIQYGKAGLGVSSLASSPVKPFRQLDRAREKTEQASSLFTELWDRAAATTVAPEPPEKRGRRCGL